MDCAYCILHTAQCVKDANKLINASTHGYQHHCIYKHLYHYVFIYSSVPLRLDFFFVSVRFVVWFDFEFKCKHIFDLFWLPLRSLVFYLCVFLVLLHDQSIKRIVSGIWYTSELGHIWFICLQIFINTHMHLSHLLKTFLLSLFVFGVRILLRCRCCRTSRLKWTNAHSVCDDSWT